MVQHHWIGPDEVAAMVDKAVAEERKRCAEVLRPFLFGDKAIEEILWGDLPDTSSMKVTVPLGAHRKARKYFDGAK